MADLDRDSCSDTSAEVLRQHHQQRPRRKYLKPALSTVKDVVLTAFAVLGFASLVRPWNRTAATEPAAFVSCDCGNSTAEARALGCKYDSLAAAWLPAHCRDDELTAEFERSGPGPEGQWTYWRDGGHTDEVGLEEIAQMADDTSARFHMTGHWHVIHCIFYWRKEHRARVGGKMVVEGRSFSEKHSKHCGNIFLDPGRDTIAGVALNTDDE